MGEKNILAYFKSPEEAEGAAKKLQALRVVEMSIDRFTRYPHDSMSNGGLPVFAGKISSLSSLTQGIDPAGITSGILAAADPAASGMSHGGEGGPTGRDILLTVVVNDSIHHQALSVVEQSGGMM